MLPSLLQAQPIKLIYAYGPTDDIAYHQARRGTKEVNLLNYMTRTTLTSVSYLSATVDSVRITHNSYDNDGQHVFVETGGKLVDCFEFFSPCCPPV